MRKDKYHVVVVGGGIAGLSTAVAYAKNADVSSRPILVLEKEPKVGGMVTSFKRGGYLFDTVQMLSDISPLLEYYGVEVPLRRFDGHCIRIFIADPGEGTAEQIDIPAGVEAFKAMLVERFGKEGKKAARMTARLDAMFDEVRHLRTRRSLLGDISMLLRCRRIIADGELSFGQYMDKFGLKDPAVREVFDVFAAFGGLPSERVSVLFISGAMISSLRGSCRPRHGFIRLPHRLRKRAESLGGQFRCRAEVEKILTKSGTVTGVALADGEVIEADHVVAAVDTKVSLFEMVGGGVLETADPAFADKASRVRMSPSSVTVSLGLDDGVDLKGLGMDCGYNVITTGRGTFKKLFEAFDRGETAYTETCFHTAAVAPSLVVGGKPTLIIRVVPMPMGDWARQRERDKEAYHRRKQEVADFFVDKVERYLVPELRQNIRVMDIAAPPTFARFSGSPSGANYDMSPYPDNFGRYRLPMQTPIKGLLLPKLTHSIYGALQSGLAAADCILDGAITGGRSFR